MSTAIQFHNVSKQYRLGAGQLNMREFLSRSTSRLIRRRREKHVTKKLWALHDVSFELEKGHALGLIGPNGAGKSTALKLLAKITRPTSGQIKANGRIASLIELGAGFHNDLTGRENIFLNAAILGMPKQKVKSYFDQIVDFSGLEAFIDTPIKRYSSGMYIRLGFSVAAFVEPDVFLVDEVLAVGDSTFRQQCVRRIEELQAMGTTIVFVSHNLYMVKRVCDQGIFLGNGRIQYHGDIVDTINAYEQALHDRQKSRQISMGGTQEVSEKDLGLDIISIEILDINGRKQEKYNHEEPVILRVSYDAREPVIKPDLGLSFMRADGGFSSKILLSEYGEKLDDLEGIGSISIVVDPLQLTTGAYVIEGLIFAGLNVPLASRHSQWFEVTGLGLTYLERAGAFIPQVSRVIVEQNEQVVGP